MSTSASINVRFHNKFNPIELIHSLIEGGWTFNDYGHVSFLPVGDNGDYDWQWLSLQKQTEVWSILDQKIKNDEVIGIVLTTGKGLIGYELLIWEDRSSLCCNLSVNRKSLGEGSRLTDFNWYLNKIEPCFKKLGIPISSINCEHVN